MRVTCANDAQPGAAHHGCGRGQAPRWSARTGGEFARREPADNAKALAKLAGWYATGRIKPVIDQERPMQDPPHAFEPTAGRQVRGKLVLRNR